MEHTYIAIDLKSFYASAECVARGLDPLSSNLVVADPARTEKTICLAVSPSLKAFGIPGRARLFEVIQRVHEINCSRLCSVPERKFTGKSTDSPALHSNPSLELDYIVAPPRMAHYMQLSAEIYQIYLNYIAPEDIYVYSIDEVFLDATRYLNTYGMTARELTARMIRDVLRHTGITATAGIGTNLYLCKIAMDIVAKSLPADADGIRIAELDEFSYRQQLWAHRPLTDFWHIGRGYARKLAAHHMYTMGDIALSSLYNEEELYRLFGVNAELLIDHAWGWEPCTLADIKAYHPENNSLSSGQVLQNPYDFHKGRLIVREMADQMVLDLAERGLMTDQLVLTVGYDTENLRDPSRMEQYAGEVTSDFYGRQVPKAAHGTINLGRHTSSSVRIIDAVTELYSRIVNEQLLLRRICIAANHILPEESIDEPSEQMNLFINHREMLHRAEQRKKEKEHRKAILSIRRKYGKNAMLRGMNFMEGATARERNGQVGGHRAGESSI